MGAARVGTRPSGSIPGRDLPLSRLDLEPAGPVSGPVTGQVTGLLKSGAALILSLGVWACASQHRSTTEQVPAAEELSPWQVALSSTEPGSADDLRQLAKWLGDAQIVGLGENVHGAHELHRLAHRIFAHLVHERGFGVFALEVDSAHGMAIDEFVQGERDDLDDILAGSWWAGAHFYDQALRDLLWWMRDYNRTATEPIHFAGFDAKQSPLAIEQLQRGLRENDPAAAAQIGEHFADVESLGHLGVFPNVLGYSATLEITLPTTELTAARTLRVSLRVRGSGVTFGKIGLQLWAAGVPLPRVTVDGSELAAERTIEGSIEVPADADSVYLTVFHRGNGTVWFDQLVAELEGEPLTAPPILAEAEMVPLAMPDFQQLDYTAEVEPGPSSALRVTGDPRLTTALASADRVAEIVEHYLADRPLHPNRAKLRQLAQVVVQAAKWRTLAEPNRDVFLADNLEWLADHVYPGKRILALAHTGHSERVPERMGDFLAQRRGEGYRTVSMLAQSGAKRYFPPPSRTPTGRLPTMEVLELTPQKLRPLDRALGAWADGDAMILLRDHTLLRDILGDDIDLDRAPNVAIVVGSVTPARPL